MEWTSSKKQACLANDAIQGEHTHNPNNNHLQQFSQTHLNHGWAVQAALHNASGNRNSFSGHTKPITVNCKRRASAMYE
jgi:hypothetical protein